MIGVCYSDTTQDWVAFSWTSAGGIKNLPATSGCSMNWADMILDDGTIAVSSSSCSDGSIHNYIVESDGTVKDVPNYCTGSGEVFALDAIGVDGYLGGFCQYVQNQQIYYKAVFVSKLGAITYINTGHNQNDPYVVNLFTSGPFGVGSPESGVGTYNDSGGFVFEGSTAYDFSQVGIGNNIISVRAGGVDGQIVGQATSTSTDPAYVAVRAGVAP
jgi:hypothetical protein